MNVDVEECLKDLSSREEHRLLRGSKKVKTLLQNHGGVADIIVSLGLPQKLSQCLKSSSSSPAVLVASALSILVRWRP